jgi:hypothetical protein
VLVGHSPAVPEPATLTLFGFALFGLGAMPSQIPQGHKAF